MDDLEVFARTLYGEAEPDDVDDVRAIANVIMNRVKLPNWPNTISGVCMQPLQFSCWNQTNPRRQHLLEANRNALPWLERCFAIAEQAMSGRLQDITSRSTHYYATYAKKPKWAKGKTPVFQTPWGKYNHLFFNDIDTPPPQTATQALDQISPISQSRTVRIGQVTGAAGTVSVIAGGLAELTPALPVLSFLRENLPFAMILIGVVAVAAAGYLIYIRLDARRKGAR